MERLWLGKRVSGAVYQLLSYPPEHPGRARVAVAAEVGPALAASYFSQSVRNHRSVPQTQRFSSRDASTPGNRAKESDSAAFIPRSRQPNGARRR